MKGKALILARDHPVLCIAALAAAGVSRVSDIAHIERGYERLEEHLSSLGAKITRE